MAIQELNRQEIEEVSGGSLDLSTLLSPVFDLVGSVVSLVSTVVGTVVSLVSGLLTSVLSVVSGLLG
ncbi:hypothetical protein EZJ19_02980 [Parasulfuritortus cantonensis]|uniref:Uncharacterized protein n=1 Tax=Parasulfuritortus cantonensis TaxID=2528202 RepID=A0A4R1BLA6_9PROT|nr:hypothetical protein [Parasulfuritortus cantonensis]TCJ18211.1 hypothetical protein EZJ19_02980 [Parasulfuritortus cantonensis]